MLVLDFVARVAIMRKQRSIPILSDMAIGACFFHRPEFLELITVRIIVTPVALFKVAHLADLRAMTTLASHFDMRPCEWEVRSLMVKPSLGRRPNDAGSF